MDRKGMVAVAIAIVVMVVWQIKFAPKYVAPPVAAPSPTPMASVSPTPIVTPVTAPTAQTDTIPETLESVSSPSVQYDFTNLGGGISRAELSKYPAESGNVRMNEFGSLPIGAISENPGEAATEAYAITSNAAGGEVLCERTGSNGLQIVKKFTLPKTDDYRMQLDVTFTNRGAEPWKSSGYYLYVGSAAAIHQRDLPTYTGFDFYRNG
ncbi:MAG: YidC/Oxa1 family rane protein insertase, partial [Chthoniobacter sp.]|nr:YidC/Oxa1 family rane protein insertase [Chthoniobacter sp.]